MVEKEYKIPCSFKARFVADKILSSDTRSIVPVLGAGVTGALAARGNLEFAAGAAILTFAAFSATKIADHTDETNLMDMSREEGYLMAINELQPQKNIYTSLDKSESFSDSNALLFSIANLHETKESTKNITIRATARVLIVMAHSNKRALEYKEIEVLRKADALLNANPELLPRLCNTAIDIRAQMKETIRTYEADYAREKTEPDELLAAD